MARRTRTPRRAILKLSLPPGLATWLFNHLTRREHQEALAGDLLEEYGRRRSDIWYWRQVLVAIAADFATELRFRWGQLRVCAINLRYDSVEAALSQCKVPVLSFFGNTIDLARVIFGWRSYYFCVSGRHPPGGT